MLPFQVEYAKSSRSKCFVCSQKIDQDSLRMAVMVQAKNFDGKIPQWHHFDCFYKKTTPPDCNLIQGYSDVRWEDQQKIKAKFEGTVASGDTGDKSSTSSSKKTFKLALCGKKKLNCTNCFSEIEPKVFGGVHISFAGTDPKKPNVMHLDCFAVKRDDLQCSVETKKLDGFKDLPVETQNHVTEQLPTAIKRKSKSKDGPSAKQKKLDDKNSELEEKLKEQNNQLWKLRDHLQKMYKKSDWDTLIEENSLGAPKGIKNTVDQLVDAIYFGTPNRCGECRGRIVPIDSGYKCIGNLTQWTRCMFTTQTPLRSKFRLGAQFSDDAFLKSSCKSIKEKIFPKIPEDKEEAIHVDSALESQRPLDDLNFVVDEGLDLEAAIKSNLEKLGADESKTVNENTAFIIADSNESKSFRIKAAGKKKIHAIKPIHCSRMRAGSVAHIMKNCNIATWDVKRHKMQLVAARETAALIKERNESRMDGAKDKGFGIESEKEKIKVSAGGGIDSGFFAAANLAPTTKVQLMKTESGDGAYSAVLNLVDIVTGTNSYYKLQIVEVPSTSDCYLYRAWGRVGTNIGGSKVEKGRNYDLRRDFKCLYQEKTGNSWDNRNYFEKKAGKFFPVDVDYEVKDDESDAKKSLQDSPKKDSSLPPAVQKVIRMIFDVKVMEDALIEFEIDLKKMPLGKLSKKQINSAYLVLTELSNLIASKSSNRGLLVDATNRFYTLIPHDFGVKSIPVIDSEDVIKEKGDMLDNLLEIEVAYSLLEDEGQGESPLDAHYKKLQCQMSPLDRSDKDFKMVKDFVEKTHCDTHYLNLVVLDVFKIARGNEESRFKKWADSDNRMLLWHGSRITNFAGILSQGLRIAPPEAPRSGYMFGKGIYFADMVTKSANYCCVSSGKEGLMLLAEVALGKQHFLKCSDSSLPETLPKGCNSTKGCGRSHPNESTYITLDNGTVVPVGEQEDSDDSNMHLRYNEYIVYDLSQVQLRYLVKLRFDSSY